MTQKLDELLSAAVDGELSESELKSLLDSMQDNPELQEKWRCYHLIKSNLCNEMMFDERLDVCQAVSQQISSIEIEPHAQAAAEQAKPASNAKVVSLPVKDTKDSFWKPFASMAVAASVTAVVILGGQYMTADSSAPYPQIAQQQPPENQNITRAQFSSALPTNLAPANRQADIIRDNKALKKYMQQHDQQTQNQDYRWQVNWMPRGFYKVREQFVDQGEMALFSNGKQAISVTVSRVGQEGLIKRNHKLALSKRHINGEYVTVVGEVPLLVAAKIADSLAPR